MLPARHLPTFVPPILRQASLLSSSAKPAFATSNRAVATTGLPIKSKPILAIPLTSSHRPPRPTRVFPPWRSASTDSAPRSNERELNMGRCTTALQTHIDHFCEQGLVDTSIYASNLEFYEPHIHVHLTSRTQYLWAARLMRWWFRVYFSDMHMVCTGIQQHRQPPRADPAPPAQDNHHDPDEGALRVSFMFTGISRVRVVWNLLTAQDAAPSVWEGRSVYTFDRHGLVAKHWIEYIAPRPTLWGFPSLWRPLSGAGIGGDKQWRGGWDVVALRSALGRRRTKPPPNHDHAV